MDLERALLSLCKRAVAEQRWDVAEHLLAALEALCRTAPEAAASLEQVYLSLGAGDAATRVADRQPQPVNRRRGGRVTRWQHRSFREQDR